MQQPLVLPCGWMKHTVKIAYIKCKLPLVWEVWSLSCCGPSWWVWDRWAWGWGRGGRPCWQSSCWTWCGCCCCTCWCNCCWICCCCCCWCCCLCCISRCCCRFRLSLSLESSSYKLSSSVEESGKPRTAIIKNLHKIKFLQKTNHQSVGDC